jgi:predicted transposase YdaD
MSTKIQEALKKKKASKKRKYDSAWKNIIRKLFKNFLEFFFPEIYQAIDFTKEIHFLDKELNEIDPDSNIGDRVADVLVKVYLKDGSSKYICIFIHLEVQSQPIQNFMEKMYIYNFRTFDLNIEDRTAVISVAILADEDANYRPDEYCVSLLGFELRMKIPMVKIIDYKWKKELSEILETSTNPMSMVVKAQLKSHEVKKAGSERRFEVTKELIRQCYKHGYSEANTRLIMRFFAMVIRLPEAFKGRLKEVIKKAEEEFKMEYIPLWERDAERRGERKGMKKQAKETAKNLLKMGLDIEKVSEATGLKKKEIEKLKETPQGH